jgi:predicted TIM-barrel enzyme
MMIKCKGNTSAAGLMIFKTDIKSDNKLNEVKPILNDHPFVIDWSVDMEDVDNVLRVESDGIIVETHIEKLLKEAGFFCEELPD